MPHDLKGDLLKEGDYIWIPAVVKSIQAHDEYCNMTAETTEPMYPGQSKCSITLNCKQVLKAINAEREEPDGSHQTGPVLVQSNGYGPLRAL